LALSESLDRFRRAGLPVAALVRRDRAEAGLRQRLQLMAPGVPEFGKTMAHHDRKALAGLSQMHFDTIGLDESMDELS
jgi:hypothetical protein